MKTLLILSEVQQGLSSGGGVAGYDRARLLARLGPTAISYVDWNDMGRVALDAQLPCLPISRVGVGRLDRWVWRQVASRIGNDPWFYTLFSKAKVRRQMATYLQAEQPDVVCFDNIPATIAWEACAGLPRVYLAHNVEADIVGFVTKQSGQNERLSRMRQAMLNYEARIVRQADAVICFTQKDADALQQVAPAQRFHVIPPAFGEPAARASQAASGARTDAQPRYVILPTNAAWQPNMLSLQWFFKEVFPLVPATVPFIITGKDQDGFLAGLAQRFANVSYKGLLPRDDYERLLREATLFVNPTRFGSGFQIKLMEAIRAGVPSISTAYSNHLGPGLTATDDAAEMAQLITQWMHSRSGISYPDYAELHESVKLATQAALVSVVRAVPAGAGSQKVAA
jgi:glycosyltransferase involved in cell wall biosynthesis